MFPSTRIHTTSGVDGLHHRGGYLDDDVRVNVFTKTPPAAGSVAALDGLTG